MYRIRVRIAHQTRKDKRGMIAQTFLIRAEIANAEQRPRIDGTSFRTSVRIGAESISGGSAPGLEFTPDALPRPSAREKDPARKKQDDGPKCFFS
jgi:hypothetical protein